MNQMMPTVMALLLVALVMVFVMLSDIALSLYAWVSLDKIPNGQSYGFEDDMQGRVYIFNINESECIAVVRNGVGGVDCIGKDT